MKLENFLQQFIPDIDDIHDYIINFTTEETLPKGTLLLAPDNFSRKIFYIEEGLARTFYIKDDKDITHYFFKESDISTPLESIFFKKQSPYGIELLENSKITIINYDRIEELKEKFPAIEKIINFILVNALHSLSERLYALQFQTAKDRYNYMVR